MRAPAFFHDFAPTRKMLAFSSWGGKIRKPTRSPFPLERASRKKMLLWHHLEDSKPFDVGIAELSLDSIRRGSGCTGDEGGLREASEKRATLRQLETGGCSYVSGTLTSRRGG